MKYSDLSPGFYMTRSTKKPAICVFLTCSGNLSFHSSHVTAKLIIHTYIGRCKCFFAKIVFYSIQFLVTVFIVFYIYLYTIYCIITFVYNSSLILNCILTLRIPATGCSARKHKSRVLHRKSDLGSFHFTLSIL